MTTTLDPIPRTQTTAQAISAFNINEGCKAELAAAKVVDFAGRYDIEHDDEATIAGKKVPVKILYWYSAADDDDDIDVYRLNAAADPVEPEMAHWLSDEEHQEFLDDSREMYAWKHRPE